MALAFARFQSASRSLRITLPPGQDDLFWSRLVELTEIRQRGLTIILLLDTDLTNPGRLLRALEALPELETNGHEVSWSAAPGLPYSLFVIDDLSALLVAGNPEEEEGSAYVRFTEETEEARALCEAFDRRAAEGFWGVDPAAWSLYIRQAAHKTTTRRAIAALKRNRVRLGKTVRRELKRLPRRSCWLIKSRDSAYGLPEPPGGNHWLEWVQRQRLAVGWPNLAESLNLQKLPSRKSFTRLFRKEYPGISDADRAHATLRHFITEMLPGDRVAAVEGWTSTQVVPVRFHGWTRITGHAKMDEFTGTWKLVREAAWYRYELDLPVTAVRDATGLISATHPIHRLNIESFRRLLALAEEARRSLGDSQMLLDLAVVVPKLVQGKLM